MLKRNKLDLYQNPSEEIQLRKSKLQLKFSDTVGAEAVVFWPFSELLLWMNMNKVIYTEVIFWKFIWKFKCFCIQMKFTYSSVMCPYKLN